MLIKIIDLLNQAVQLNLFNYLDVQFAINLVNNNNPLLLLIFTILSYQTRLGHVCLFINKLNSKFLFNNKHKEFFFMLWKTIGNPNYENIIFELKQCNAVCNSSEIIFNKPLVLSGNKLYFQRMWLDEELVVNFLSSNLLEVVDEKKLTNILNYFFISSKNPNWQKIAIAVAVTSKVSIISGGPGTGKTSIIFYLLLTLIQLSNKELIIKLTAPTGKAAIKLTESLNNELLKLNLIKNKKLIIPRKAETIHSLLKSKFNNKLFFYNKNNKLLLDILIIDEASMIDLFMMARLIDAIPNNARVILLGDKNQLASIEAGSILKDICYNSISKYSYKRAIQLTSITNCNLLNFISNNGPNIKDRICLLQKSYRFNINSKIGQLSSKINQSNIKEIKKLLLEKKSDITLYSINSSDNYSKLLLNNTKCYHNYLNMVNTKQNPKKILTAFNNYRLLAAVREGPYGVINLNNKLEYLLYHQGYIKKYPEYNHNNNYEGRPIMITKNNYFLGLFNGDIGIILRENKQDLKAYFQSFDGEIRKIELDCLSDYETVFVMTVHKSQGSEFNHIGLIIPPIFTTILSKELIYTAITRAKKQLTIYAEYHMLIKAIMNPTKRYSGLFNKLF